MKSNSIFYNNLNESSKSDKNVLKDIYLTTGIILVIKFELLIGLYKLLTFKIEGQIAGLCIPSFIGII